MIAKEFESITGAYLWSLKKLEMNKFSIDHLIITLTNPLANWKSNISTFSIDQQLNSVMPIAPYEQFHDEYGRLNEGGVFDKKSGKSGKDWIIDRVKILCPLEGKIDDLKKSIREFDKMRGHHSLKKYNYLKRSIN